MGPLLSFSEKVENPGPMQGLTSFLHPTGVGLHFCTLRLLLSLEASDDLLTVHPGLICFSATNRRVGRPVILLSVVAHSVNVYRMIVGPSNRLEMPFSCNLALMIAVPWQRRSIRR